MQKQGLDAPIIPRFKRQYHGGKECTLIAIGYPRLKSLATDLASSPQTGETGGEAVVVPRQVAESVMRIKNDRVALKAEEAGLLSMLRDNSMEDWIRSRSIGGAIHALLIAAVVVASNHNSPSRAVLRRDRILLLLDASG
jgi:hypothetical protein